MQAYAPHPEIQILQAPDELAHITQLYKAASPQRVLEIGTWQGGTLHTWLTQHEPEIVVAVDLEHTHGHLYRGWKQPNTKLHTIAGASQNINTRAHLEMLAPFDWLFVDGDHDEEAVAADAELCESIAAPGALMLLHDIEPGHQQPHPTGPRVVFENARARGLKVWELVQDPHPWPHKHGVGVIQL